MFIPEYSISPTILNNIANIEYGKAIIETSTLLPAWQKQLEKEAKTKTVMALLKDQGYNIPIEQVKKYIDGVKTDVPYQVTSTVTALELIRDMALNSDFDEESLKTLNTTLGGTGNFRNKKVEGKADPEVILAELVGFFDWLGSRDAMETHPLLKAAITKAFLEKVQPFEQYNSVIANLSARMCLLINSYNLNSYTSIENRYGETPVLYMQYIETLSWQEPNFTLWIEYFTDEMTHEVLNLKEKVSMLARDTKIAKVSGRAKLSPRQERIVEFLQDYGILQNKDFSKLFPGVSEDSILRDLKVLIKQHVIAKNGSTKSSRYELI